MILVLVNKIDRQNLIGEYMQTHHCLVWIDHRSAMVIHFDRENEKIVEVMCKHGKEHLHHKADAVGDGNIKLHRDYFVDVMDAIGTSDEILLAGPADAKTEFVKYAKTHRPQLANFIVKVETMDRATPGELVDHARHYFSMLKPRLG
jgi:stalled ribosome rescue protein Dom34